MEKGFFTALGTPITKNGKLHQDSFTTHIEAQLRVGASGMLVMGSMGIGPYIRDNEYKNVAAHSVQVTKGRAPVLVGVSDVSIARVVDRIDVLSGLALDGVVSTVPYYNAMSQQEVLTFFTYLAEYSTYPIYLYDLAVVTKTPILPDTIRQLWKHPNIRGIKSGNLETVRSLYRSPERPETFDIVFSGLDVFDIAYCFGINKNLDGMFACCPRNAQKMYTHLAAGEFSQGSEYLDRILKLRDLFIQTNSLLGAFTQAMNMLGCEGNFAQDYAQTIDEGQKEKVHVKLIEMGEL